MSCPELLLQNCGIELSENHHHYHHRHHYHHHYPHYRYHYHMPAASLRTQKAVASQATTWQQQPSGLVFSNLTTLEKPMSLKVARAPSRELVALLEGTDEALDGLEGLGEVRKATSSSWHLFLNN